MITTQEILGRSEIITFVMKTKSPKIRRPMYCPNCGTLLQFTYKQVAMIIQGAAAPEEVNDEIKCKRCPTIFEIC